MKDRCQTCGVLKKDRHSVLVFIGGKFHRVRVLDTFKAACAYTDGVDLGAVLSGDSYSRPSCYVVPCNERELEENEHPDEIARATAAMHETLSK